MRIFPDQLIKLRGVRRVQPTLHPHPTKHKREKNFYCEKNICNLQAAADRGFNVLFEHSLFKLNLFEHGLFERGLFEEIEIIQSFCVKFDFSLFKQYQHSYCLFWVVWGRVGSGGGSLMHRDLLMLFPNISNRTADFFLKKRTQFDQCLDPLLFCR